MYGKEWDGKLKLATFVMSCSEQKLNIKGKKRKEKKVIVPFHEVRFPVLLTGVSSQVTEMFLNLEQHTLHKEKEIIRIHRNCSFNRNAWGVGRQSLCETKFNYK